MSVYISEFLKSLWHDSSYYFSKLPLDIIILFQCYVISYKFEIAVAGQKIHRKMHIVIFETVRNGQNPFAFGHSRVITDNYVYSYGKRILEVIFYKSENRQVSQHGGFTLKSHGFNPTSVIIVTDAIVFKNKDLILTCPANINTINLLKEFIQ